MIASTEIPEIVSRARLLSRNATGLGRLLRGTDQATFKAFCSAWPRPSEPYVAASTPTTTPVVDPWSPSGRPSSSPMIGNVVSAESRTCFCSSSLPWRTNPKIDVASSRMGKTASVA